MGALVIGYGNTLRQDDAAGPRTAERVEALELRGVSVVVAPQLSPEHVEAVVRARFVVFVDAAIAGGEVRVRPIAPAASSEVTAHALEPRTVLALARDVFDRVPPAWLITIPAVRLGFGEDLSPSAESGIAQAVRVIAGMCGAISTR